MVDATHYILLMGLFVFLAESRFIYEGSGEMCWLECADYFKPVCGSNGMTYGNECQLIRDRQCNGLVLKKKYDGPCFRKRVPSSIKAHVRPKARGLCSRNRWTICSMMGGICVKHIKEQTFVCLRPNQNMMVNIAI
ncbi:kazal-type proteinase inhibitor [Apostichopus japonicus]|uniref:Kazal-type proteinase inhibitor n=1 Tax=Stichopus japonicus TaxID=307972 RepID=A0A2G8KQP5_STIJA|nr:kazal-type proteinase inhibitor [Apostichopus japonicus]